MSSKPKRRLKKEPIIVFVILLIIVLIAVAVKIHKGRSRFVFNERLDEIVVTIDDTSINLKELSYYIAQVEETGNQYALVYDKNDPLAYWNLYMQDATSSGYVTDLAKRAAVNYCIRDNIYAKEAEKAGISLSEDEISDIRYDAEQAYNLMPNKKRKQTCLTAEDFEIIMTKEKLSYKYMSQLAMNDPDGVLEGIVLKYDVDGSYYETLKLNYNITTNDAILDKVRVGFITIN